MTTENAPAPEPRRESESKPRIVGGSWGISIVVVISMIAAAVANVQMMGSSNERTAKLEEKIEGQSSTLKDIRTLIGDLASATQRDISALQRENADIRERMAREGGELRLQIAEIRSAMLAAGR